jgi:thiol-disulfide isomerase/thioredoxin
MKNIFQKISFAILMLCSSVFVFAQDKIILRIGDSAPALKYSKWIKGEPVTSFDGDQLYVLEFWATWCGPCKAAMPHLTQLQKEYEGKATFIGVDVWEHHGDESKSYESYLPAIEKFVKGNEANMGYSVIADNNDEFMANNWLKAAGLNGIPATFIIKNHKIIWTGHPILLDTTLPKIIDGSYDMKAYKTAYEEKSEKSRKQVEEMTAAVTPIKEAIKAKDYKKAFELMDSAKAKVPILKISLDYMKFTTLLKEVSEKEAIAFAETWQKGFKSAPTYVVNAVQGEDGLSKTTYLWAAKNCESSGQESNPVLFHMLAACYAKANDYKNAVINEEKAVQGAKTALKKGKMIGTIMDYTVTEYEQALTSYKNEGKMAAK